MRSSWIKFDGNPFFNNSALVVCHVFEGNVGYDVFVGKLKNEENVRPRATDELLGSRDRNSEC